MKTLSLEQMEGVKGGKFWSCVGQVAGGMGVLATVASIGIFAITPIGWGFFAFAAISLTADMIADPNACDS
jgi:hypothetical protein